jgi:hypothetical protein
MGIETVLGWVVGMDIKPIEIMGCEVIPAAAEFTPGSGRDRRCVRVTALSHPACHGVIRSLRV